MKNNQNISRIIAAFLMLFVVCFVNAQSKIAHHSDNVAHKTDHSTDHYTGHHGSHFSKHHIAVFEGIISNFDHHTNVNAFGVDYEFRPTKFFGVGFAGERVFSEEGEYLLGLPLFVHPVGGLKFAFAPIAINAVHHTEDIGGHSTDPHHELKKEWFFGARFNMAYDIHINHFSIGPSVSYDLTETDALIYGLALGVGF